MLPSDDTPADLARAQRLPPAADNGEGVLAPRTVTAGAIAGQAHAVPAELSGLLLPTESVTFASSPHPIVFVGPLVGIAAIVAALAVVLAWQLHPIVRGHHVAVPLVAGSLRTVVLVVALLLLLRAIASLVKVTLHFLGTRIVTTNRRVFIVNGIFGRHVTPIGNTALAGATMSQGLLGRMFGFGTVFMPLASSAPSAIRDMRDPIRLYREFEAVANGVEGDTWKMAIRQTQIP
jgi:Tfp pilus assembly protein PilN